MLHVLLFNAKVYSVFLLMYFNIILCHFEKKMTFKGTGHDFSLVRFFSLVLPRMFSVLAIFLIRRQNGECYARKFRRFLFGTNRHNTDRHSKSAFLQVTLNLNWSK